MTNEVHIKITADKPDTSGIKQVKDDLDGLKTKAKETIPVIEGVTKSVGDSGKRFSDTERQIRSLDDSIIGSNNLLKQLAGAFADTDDAAQKIDIKKAMDRVQADLTTASKAKKLITPIEPEIPPSKLKQLTDDLTYTAKTAAANWKPLLGAGAVAAAPLIGSAMAGAIIGGAGIGGVVGGILLVKDDPRVIAAAQGLKSRVGDQLKTAAKPFVDTTVQGLATIETSLHRIDFEGIFKKASTFVQPLSTAVGHVAEDLGAGFGALVQVADPVIKRIASGLEDIGSAARDGMQSLTDNAGTAADSLGTLLDGVTSATKATFGLVNGLTELKAKFDSGAGGIFAFDSGLKLINKAFEDSGNGTKWVDPIDAFNNSVANGITTVDSYGQVITSAGQSLGDFAAQELAAGSATRNLFDDASNVGEAFDNLTESIKKNGHTLDSTTEKGRANRRALSQVASTLNEQYAATVAVNGASAETDKVASMNYSSFIKVATALTGSAKKAREYAAQLGVIPPKKNTDVHANTTDAAARIRALQGQINALRGKTVTIRTVITGGSLAGGIHVSGPGGSGTLTKAAGGVVGAASGGVRSNMTLVGEQGPELVDLPAGSRVMTAGDSNRWAAQNAGGGRLELVVSAAPGADNDLMRAIIENLRFNIRGLGAGNVQQFLGQPGRG